MKHSNIALRISFGAVLFCHLLPFFQIAMIFEGATSITGLGVSFGGKLPNGEDFPPSPLIICLFLNLAGFALCFRKKLAGRWIGILPLFSLWVFINNLQTVEVIGFSFKPAIGMYLATLCSIVTAVIAFIGRTKAPAEPPKTPETI